ncbi:Hsp70 family protein [bacterium]|nr:Hsp70 family protein [bacterium]
MSFFAGHTVGIDLGTSSSAIATLDAEGEPQVLPNSADELITPSVIVMSEDGQVVVGPTADWMHTADPEKVITGIKRQMGNPDYTKMVAGRQLNAEFFSALILMKLKQDAETRLGAPIANAVITVPYYFNDPCRRATQNAGTIAGLNVVDILNEPTAATLAYAWNKGVLGRADLDQTERTMLVYDLGGGTFDVTVVKYSPTSFQVLATDGDTFLGGLDWTRRLVNHVAEQFRNHFRLDPRDEGRSRLALTEECDDVKRQLSLEDEWVLEFAHHGKNLKTVITRKEFEKLTADLLQRTRDTTEFVIDAVDMNPRQLDEVVLIGGSTYMPAVQRMLSEMLGKDPVRVLDPQLAVAQGAAIHAAILETRETGGSGTLSPGVLKRLGSIRSIDVNAHSLGIEITDPADKARKLNHIMIPRNTPLPVEFKQRFVTNTANPSGILVRLLEGETKEAASCTFIGDFRISGLPPNLPVGTPVEVAYRYDENRCIHVEARELVGNNQSSCEIRWTNNVRPISVDAMTILARDYHVN